MMSASGADPRVSIATGYDENGKRGDEEDREKVVAEAVDGAAGSVRILSAAITANRERQEHRSHLPVSITSKTGPAGQAAVLRQLWFAFGRPSERSSARRAPLRSGLTG